MNIQSVYLGASANDSTGDTLRAGGFKIDDNFKELFSFSAGRHRQSLLLYKTLSGSPAFLEYTTGLHIDLIAPLVATIGAGFEQRGERNSSVVITADALSAWTVPNTTVSYLYIEQNSLSGTQTFSATQILPYKAQTFVPGPTVDQYWFDTLNNQMFRWDGAIFQAVNRIFVAAVSATGGNITGVTYYTNNDESDYVDAASLSARNYTTAVSVSATNYTDAKFLSAQNYTDLKTTTVLLSAKTYADNSAKKYALVFG